MEHKDATLEEALEAMRHDLAQRTTLDKRVLYDAGFVRGFYAAMSVVRRLKS